MELILWRHAEAEDGYPDTSRRLTALGHEQAAAMAAWLRGRVPQTTKVLCSPAERCQQTAAALTRNFETIPEIAPGATFRTLLKVSGWPNEKGTIVLVNHQPTLGELAAYLLCGEVREWKVKKGAVWWLSIKRGVSHMHVSLKAAISPDVL